MSLSAYRHSAAEIAAAALFESFPGVELLGGGETSIGFSYDAIFPHPVHSETLAMIEQAMRQIVRERREIRLLEMVPFSARELLKSKGLESRAEELDSHSKQLVHVVQIGAFYDLSESEQLKNSNQLSAFKLDKITPLENGVMRLTGFAYPTKEELNEFLKRLKRYPDRRHEILGEIQSLWKIEGQEIVWLQKGLKLINQFIQFFEKNILQNVEQIGAPLEMNRFSLMKEMGRPIAEITPYSVWIEDPDAGLYGNKGSQIKIYTRDTKSLLQLIEKSLIILGLVYKREFLLEDALGREWPVVSVESKSGDAVVAVSIEKILALLLEKYERLERLTIENQ